NVWPPNHQLVSVSVLGVSGGSGPIQVQFTGIRQDEPVVDAGGDTCPDASGVGTSAARVRAERNGNGDGRVYHLAFTATDPAGATCSGEVKVCVPHAQGHGKHCVDGGATYDATGPCGGDEPARTPRSVRRANARAGH